MRELKFRAWHPEKKQMFSPEEMGVDELTLLPDGRGFINVSSVDTQLSQLIPMIPMQYTGLKDKNGKERYQGDIIRRGSYVFVEEIKTFSLRPNGHAGAYGYSYMPDDEIIGNIYEHPELLSPAG